MFLKAVEIFGFKSFGERVYIEFNRGLTSIVGPNGSGKSNILDAVLWVLGEQSYKNIRAKESSDVIFSGGKDKKAMNFAEVSLYIDNSDSFLAVENDEIKITRKLHSTGENEYFINDSKSRLKDIANLFLDTGVGKSAYSVIGQGKVERIISSSSKEIKSIIEEAAGIKKFQGQKNEAVKNLENVDTELEKIDLILNEVGENRDKVEKQAGKAQEYLELKKERDSLAKGIYQCEYNNKNSELDKSNQSKENLDSENNKLQTEFEEIENRLEIIDKKKIELKKYIEENGNKNQELKREIESKEKEKVRISERCASYKREIEERESRVTAGESKIEEKRKSLAELDKESLLVAQKIELLSEENQIFEKEIKDLEKSKEDFETAREIKKKKVMELELEKMKLINEIENSNRRVKGSTNKINSLKEELEAANKKIFEAEKELVSAKKSKEEKTLSLENIKGRGEFLEKEISRCSQRMNKLSEIIRSSDYDEKRYSSKLQALLRMEENNEGFFKGVKEVLNSKIPGVEGVFISLVNVPEKYMKAIEAGVPGNIQDIIVSTSDVAKKAINILKEKKVGRASFLALDTIKVTPKKEPNIKLDGVIGLASNLVETQDRYKIVAEFILGNLLVVENMDTALKIIKNSLFAGNVVTLSGELLSSRGRITGGDSGNSTASQLFERKREIKQLKEQVEILKKRIEESVEEQNKINKELENFENEIDRIDSTEEELRKQVRLASEYFEECNSKVERVSKEIRTIKIELDEEIKYSEEFEKKITNSNNEMDKIQIIVNELKKEEEEDILKAQKINSIITQKREEFSDKKIIFLNAQDRISQIEREKAREEKEYKILLSEKEDIKQKISLLRKEVEVLEKSESALTQEIDERLQKYESENIEITEKKQINEKLSEEERELIKKRKEIDSFLLHKRDALNKLNDLIERLKSDLERLKENLESLEEIESVEISIENIKECKERFKSLDNRLKNFQAVNLLAIEEFKELNEKYTFLSSQKEDLVKGKNVLLDLIKEIDETIHSRFFTAYKAIDENFNKMCMETINNAEGKLILNNPDNFDECGVEIFVKFRNKKRQSLSLLSGGEKSMVAIAFIMGIFMFKPSPFTFLDEIEAALDEKNTRKLIGKLKEFTDKSQFILITHNKDTMRESESIFGVTMNKEIGISKIVPVKF
ncbi:chromosome segregation protein SMC [Fusobacterium mortiferum]|uniref:Chromosome partition protein Smc n=1 Tax=Fusobacterium mortiferum ATCC 9817 TaxID=469616 RepID=A0ABN5JBG8_FUSMR|nr:chromosome segregation protein SMC [Fusobacterium mortiferum]AVQ19731.1 chromosome segregation protein SMC [Fusobacterium mortiferum ATCC 9817]EEO35839.1 chromosome segregation protein SMC [Fusobacterium mortiferum ATCC 9817]